MVADRPQWSDAELVRAATSDDPEAFGALFERWFDRVYDVARNIVRNDDTAAEVAQDVFLTSWQRIDQLDDPERFGGWLLRAGRNRALNRLEKERRAQPLEGDVMTGLHESRHGGTGDRDDLVGSNRLLETDAISEARDQQSLVWDAAAALGERDVSLLDLQLRHQLSPAEIADELGVTANNAHQLLFRLRNKLGDAVANHQVWRNGSPRCEELAALVDGDPFDGSTNKIVQRHASRCEICGPERERVVDPAKLFAAVPIAIAPPFVRDQAAAALAADGVPVESPSPPDSGTPGGEADGGQSEVGQADTGQTEAGQTGAGQSDGRPDPSHPQSGETVDVAETIAPPTNPVQTSSNPVTPMAAGPAPSTPPAIASAEPPPAAEPMASAERSSTRRRLAFALVASVVLVGLVVALARPAGDVDLATGPTSSDAAGDVADDDELATTPTTEAPTTAVPTTEPPTTAAPTTEAPTTEPPATRPPSTPPPSTEPPVTEPPSTQPPPTPSPPTDPPPPPPPPVIVRFTLSTPGGAIFCPNSTDAARTARWFTEETTSVTVTTPNGTTSGGFEGTHTFCAPFGSTITLTASGPGGTVSETETIS